MGLSLKGFLRTIGEPFEAVGKFLGHSAKEIGKAIGKNPALLTVLPIVFPQTAPFLKSIPILGSLFGSNLSQPSDKNPTTMALDRLLPLLLVAGGDARKVGMSLILPQILQNQDLKNPMNLITTLMALSAFEEPKPITPMVFSPLTPQQTELLNKAIAMITPPTIDISPFVNPTVSNPFAPFTQLKER